MKKWEIHKSGEKKQTRKLLRYKSFCIAWSEISLQFKLIQHYLQSPLVEHYVQKNNLLEVLALYRCFCTAVFLLQMQLKTMYSLTKKLIHTHHINSTKTSDNVSSWTSDWKGSQTKAFKFCYLKMMALKCWCFRMKVDTVDQTIGLYIHHFGPFPLPLLPSDVSSAE